MEPWLIALIVILILLFVILPLSILSFAGIQTLKMLKKDSLPMRQMKGVDVSFYDKGPLAKLAEDGIKYMDSLKPEEVHITSFDGFKLHAYVFKNPYQETNKYFLGMHGFKSGPRHEYGPYIDYYLKLGFNVIIPDERAHYLSEGDYITMGMKEKYDVKSWCEYIVNTYGEDIKILIQGVSMGGATVCLASKLDLPKQVVGIVSDCAYSSVKKELKFMISRYVKHAPTGFFIQFINLFFKAKTHVSFNDEQPIDAIKEAKVPVLFFHGEKDEMVDVNFSKELYENCGSKKKLVIVPEANHAESVAYKKQEYFDIIKEFFEL